MTNLVITSYCGARRQLYNNPVSDLMIHYDWLHTISHSLDLVTIVCTSDSNGFTKKYIETIDRFKYSKDIKCDIIFRENNGASYGSFSDAFAKHSSDFDYYYFLEDDYAVTEDNFDDYLIDQIKSDKTIGYVPAFSGRKDQMPHGSIPSGMFSTSALVAAAGDGRIIYGTENSYWGAQGYESTQYLQAQQILDSGYKIVDNINRRRSWFLGSTNDHETIMCFEYEKFDKQLIVPTQCYLDYLQFDKYLLKNSLVYNSRLTEHYQTLTHSCDVSGLRYLSNYMNMEF